MLAPSEKHLEDWMVHAVESGQFEWAKRLIGRQVVLPSGIADLLLLTSNWLTVVELKKGDINDHTIAQVLRYMGDLRGIYEAIVCDLHDQETITWDEFDLIYGSHDPDVQGMVIGATVSDPHLSPVCEAAGISLVRYHFDGSTYGLEAITTPAARRDDALYQTYAKTPLGVVLKEIIFGRLSRHRSLSEDMGEDEDEE